jgi:hypothetical protein
MKNASPASGRTVELVNRGARLRRDLESLLSREYAEEEVRCLLK